MDLTQGTLQHKKGRAKKMMLWFGIVSLVMSFGGLTSAFIVSSTREDWLTNFELPQAFTASTIIIILSSIVLYFSKKALLKQHNQLSISLLLGTFVLGLAFIYTQLSGFSEIIQSGYNFTGPTSNITMSYIYIIAVVHILHVLAGLICLIVVIINHLKNKYTPTTILGFELASTFWHFVDILWLYLFFFLYFFNKIN
ncbi:cytochrome c oxidase subunit 3 [Flavobacteriaceae bacterium]|nr:cytochrome c oxidase subunit 3 [Flavobacteriaceae bacterium]MDB2632232.1 cytochrome c oxidase subunit 3 [Flavobacteriaceae bacterium]CAI8394524.1 MAG: Cytochrome c oxidase subunit 3 [Formosa sp. Hel3_A1_48]